MHVPRTNILYRKLYALIEGGRATIFELYYGQIKIRDLNVNM